MTVFIICLSLGVIAAPPIEGVEGVAAALEDVFAVTLLLITLRVGFGVETAAGKAKPKNGNTEKRTKTVAQNCIMKIEYVATGKIYESRKQSK